MRTLAERRRPQELLTAANAILGQGQLSLAKYLWIAAREDDESLDVFDFIVFQNLFAMGDLTADFDADGALSVFDFFAFQNLFAAGC